MDRKRGNSKRLNRYLAVGYRGVDGWLAQSSAEMVAALALYQVDNGLIGAAGEIGVRSFCWRSPPAPVKSGSLSMFSRSRN